MTEKESPGLFLEKAPKQQIAQGINRPPRRSSTANRKPLTPQKKGAARAPLLLLP
jgi:hypothetical protein